jgi:hypothetical protein
MCKTSKSAHRVEENWSERQNDFADLRENHWFGCGFLSAKCSTPSFHVSLGERWRPNSTPWNVFQKTDIYTSIPGADAQSRVGNSEKSFMNCFKLYARIGSEEENGKTSFEERRKKQLR